jgi:hypothetical protein
MTPTPFRVVLPAVLAFLAGFTPAQNPELDAARKRIEDLRAHAAQLQERGRDDEAQEMLQEARAIEEKLRRVAERGQQGNDSDKILRGLEMGMESLKALGRHDALEMLQQIADEVRRERKEARADLQPRKGKAEHPELRAAREQLQVFKVAHEGLAEGGHEEAAEQMELAVRALEMRIDGRKDEEAEEVQQSAPDHAQTTELLMLAARMLKEQDKPDRAGSVARLAEQFGQRYRKQARDGGQPARRDGDDMQRQLQQLQDQIQELQRALQDLRRERGR